MKTQNLIRKIIQKICSIFKKKIDFYVRNEFSIIVLLPESEQADNWVKENIQLEDWQNKKQIAIEPRYFEDIYEGLLEAGMKLEAA